MDTLLGSTLTVSHVGPVTTHNETVNVGMAGREDELVLPAVWILGEFGTTNPASVGGGASQNIDYLDLSIETLDDTDIDGGRLRTEIYSAVEALIRVSEKILSTAYFSHISNYRDQLVPTEGGIRVYKRIVTVKAVNFQVH